MTKFIFVRHGQSQANLDKVIGEPDTLLTEEGIGQARKTGHDLAGKGIKTIICSPFIRAQQTAEVIAAELGIDVSHIKIIEDLHERRLGSFEGKPREHDSEWYYLSTQGDMEPPEAVIKRSQAVLEQIKELGRDGTVLVVGHAVSGFYLLQVAKGITNVKNFPPASQMPNAELTEVEL